MFSRFGRRGKVARIDGVDIHWLEAGSGPTLVLLHGIGDSHQTWSKVVPALARTRRVLVPDLLGHGHSGRPDATYALEWHARMIAKWLEHLEVDEADVVGHSYGGGVAQWMLLDPSHRVRRLGLVCAGGLGRDVAFALRLASVPFVVEHMGGPFMATGTFVALQAAIRGVYSVGEIARLSFANATPGTARAFARTVRDVIDFEGQRRGIYEHAHSLQRVPPIGLFWGDSDPVIPIEHAIDAARLIEGAKMTCFARCGHYPHRERPGVFVDALESFLGVEAISRRSTWSTESAAVAIAG